MKHLIIFENLKEYNQDIIRSECLFLVNSVWGLSKNSMLRSLRSMRLLTNQRANIQLLF